MIILKEDSKKPDSLQEATPVGFDDVIGLAGFKGYTICGPKLYVENFSIGGATSLVQGLGSASP